MTAAPRRGLALCGQVDGIHRTFWLEAGSNRIGSRPGRGIVLGERGISKRHARIRVEADRIVIEDLGSKNGTYVNGQRVEKATILPGDSLGFGPLALVLEAVSSSHDLAVDLESVQAALADEPSAITNLPTRPSTSPLLADVDVLAIGLPPLETFVRALPTTTEGSLVDALDALASLLGQEGAAVVTLAAEAAPGLVATTDLPPTEILEALHRRAADSRRLGGGLHTDSLEVGPRTVLAAWQGWGPKAGVDDGDGDERTIEADGLAILLWGWSSELLPRAFWAIVLELVARFAGLPTFGPSESPEVRIPESYVRCPSPPMDHLFRQLGAVARSDLPILVLGATGVGKEGIARIVHASSPRDRGPFVAVNCAAIPSDLLETELFGIAKGVATGVDARVGQFDRAEGGTLFLDEIGEMSTELQAKLLRALQEKEITPVGGPPRPIDVRIVAATNIRLGQRLEVGSFRRDLYYRLAGSVLRIPTLAERPEDIPPLVAAFSRRAVKEAGISVRGIDRGAMKKLMDQPWPGNVRQLENTVRRMVLLARPAQVIDEELVKAALDEEIDGGEAGPLPTLHLDELEKRAIVEAMARSRGNQTRAAELLGITRTTLYRRLARHGLAADASDSGSDSD